MCLLRIAFIRTENILPNLLPVHSHKNGISTFSCRRLILSNIHQKLRVTNQGECHAHNHRGEDEVEGGDLKHVAVRVWVCVDIFVLSGHAQGHGTTILTVSLLGLK